MPVDHIWMFPNKPSRLWSISSKIVLSLVGSTSKLWTDCLNSFNIVNKDILYDAIEKRPVNQGLVTVSNHYSCIDEPVLWGILKWRYLIGGRNIRWTLGADNICFTKYWHSLFFSLGRVVPVCRGEGVYQKSLDFVLDQLNAGQWLHMFPEGRVNLSKEFMRLKWVEVLYGSLIFLDCVSPHSPKASRLDMNPLPLCSGLPLYSDFNSQQLFTWLLSCFHICITYHNLSSIHLSTVFEDPLHSLLIFLHHPHTQSHVHTPSYIWIRHPPHFVLHVHCPSFTTTHPASWHKSIDLKTVIFVEILVNKSFSGPLFLKTSRIKKKSLKNRYGLVTGKASSYKTMSQ
ncbi:uncharacterized protein LOC115220423 isoform X1 [Octopus sinensis]|uniref:Tafazzin family protein n=1 Tax=Octopus sinensis TaxID=2607531 RepID=A0A7E6FET1_9MOLL|nr:uncharacterized protein LOC115220423 isoform X1 [Octopus sinensis]